PPSANGCVPGRVRRPWSLQETRRTTAMNAANRAADCTPHSVRSASASALARLRSMASCFLARIASAKSCHLPVHVVGGRPDVLEDLQRSDWVLGQGFQDLRLETLLQFTAERPLNDAPKGLLQELFEAVAGRPP